MGGQPLSERHGTKIRCAGLDSLLKEARVLREPGRDLMLLLATSKPVIRDTKSLKLRMMSQRCG
jgi:hypothetical protein